MINLPEHFFTSLTIMWRGMLGIFVVMLILMIIIYLLTKFSGGEK